MAEGGRAVLRQDRRSFGPSDLDRFDREILRLLRDDGRRPNADIARAIGVSEPTVRKRLDRLREDGVIRIVGLLDPVAIGFPIHVMIGIRVRRGAAKQVGRRLAAMGCVAYVCYTTGRYDIILEAMLPSNEALEVFLSEPLASIREITQTETFHVLTTDKFSYMWDLPEGAVAED
ncbi:MAG: Lrp/AsnC family transcriptional regulator [Thermoleophilia bacterium]|nr:Lrp/AsnC family transcriptional regulator [Thermoleophilia bacterium]